MLLLMTSNVFVGSNPDLKPKARLSAKDAMTVERCILSTSFIVHADPIGPICKIFLPIVRSKGFILSKTSFLPPTSIVNVPSVAGLTLPETGADVWQIGSHID